MQGNRILSMIEGHMYSTIFYFGAQSMIEPLYTHAEDRKIYCKIHPQGCIPRGIHTRTCVYNRIRIHTYLLALAISYLYYIIIVVQSRLRALSTCTFQMLISDLKIMIHHFYLNCGCIQKIASMFCLFLKFKSTIKSVYFFFHSKF